MHVAGHTDLVAIKDPLQKKFSFNKAFLDARANNAAQVQRDTGVNSHLSAAGLVDSNSVSSNNTTGERARTDRIELM